MSALERARALARDGEDEAATAAYLAILRREPTDFAALNELAALAVAGGHRTAARTAYEQAVRFHPQNPVGRVNLGNLLLEDGDAAAARAQYEAALAADGEFAPAHQGMARALTALGEAAEAHWRKGFVGHAVTARPYRGKGAPVRVLLLVSARGGNIPTQTILDERQFAVTALYAEFFDAAEPLPPHDVAFNAIGDADLCAEALARADEILARTRAPVINRPGAVRETGRARNAERLGALPGVIAPRIVSMPRADLARADLDFPILLRAPGFHTGQHFRRIERRDDLAAALAELPGETLFAIPYLDARGPDGLARKYRVMIVGGVLHPLHLAISADWKVHYVTAAMKDDEAHRAEEARFLSDMAGVLGPRAMAALEAIAAALGLDYAGVDFGLDADGSLLLFEANATMVVNPPDSDPVWDYRRQPIASVLEAARRLVRTKARRRD